MTLNGKVQDGVVVLDDPAALPNGTMVHVTPLNGSPLPPEAGQRSATLAERWKRIAGASVDLPADAAQQHDHYLYGTPKR